jgi:hypothetical protein
VEAIKMTNLEAAANLVKLYADYERRVTNSYASIDSSFKVAVAMAIMALKETEL